MTRQKTRDQRAPSSFKLEADFGGWAGAMSAALTLSNLMYNSDLQNTLWDMAKDGLACRDLNTGKWSFPNDTNAGQIAKELIARKMKRLEHF